MSWVKMALWSVFWLSVCLREQTSPDSASSAQTFFATGLSLDEWVVRAKKPIGSFPQEANPEGPLYGEVAAFTGRLSRPRHEVAELAANYGCEVTDTVAKMTTLLIVGDQDVSRLAGYEKSSKHRKAEKLIEKGQSIRILCESDLIAMGML